MAVGIREVDAVRVTLATVDLDAGIFERALNALVVAGGKSQGHVIDLAARVDIVIDFEQCDALAAAFEKAFGGAFVVYFHAQEVYVKLLRASQIFDVKNHMVDAIDF